jgi:hypothetical protein
LLERLLLVAPEDPDLKKALVNVHIKAGDQKRVVELYESIADDLVRANRPLEAVGYLQKILLLDRSRGDVSERVRHLYEFDERSRRRGRTLSCWRCCSACWWSLGSGYWFYNQRAEEDFARIDVHEMMAADDFAGAAGAYEEFRRLHPFTTTVSRAESELQQIEAARQRFEARLTAERAGRDRELQRVRTTTDRNGRGSANCSWPVIPRTRWRRFRAFANWWPRLVLPMTWPGPTSSRSSAPGRACRSTSMRPRSSGRSTPNASLPGTGNKLVPRHCACMRSLKRRRRRPGSAFRCRSGRVRRGRDC